MIFESAPDLKQSPRGVFAVLLGIVALSISGLFAQGGEISVKIAFVNTTAILQGTAEGKSELSKLEQYITQEQQKLQTETTALDKLRSEFNSRARVLNPETSAEMQRQIQEKERKVRRMQEDMELDVSSRRNELLSRMSEKIQTVIAEYAQQNGIGAVFLEGPTLPFFATSLDITAEIIKLYDQKHPVEAPATPPTGTSN